MTDRYFDDFSVGDSFTSPSVTLTESMIVEFAFAYDPQPFHIDAEGAKATPFGGLIASGFHTMAVGFRMFLALGLFSKCSLGSPGLDELRWPRPVRPGAGLRLDPRRPGDRGGTPAGRHRETARRGRPRGRPGHQHLHHHGVAHRGR